MFDYHRQHGIGIVLFVLLFIIFLKIISIIRISLATG